MVKKSLSKTKMKNHKSDQNKKKKKVPNISIELDGSLIKLPASIFNNIIESECINYFFGGQTNKDIIGLNDLVNVQNWKEKYNRLETQARMLESIANRLKRDLETNKFAQPLRCLSTSVNQHVKVTLSMKAKMALRNPRMKHPIFTISDSEDDVIITDMSKIKPIQTKNNIIIDLIDLDNDTQNLETKYKPAPKSKTNCKSDSEDDVIITDTLKIKPIRTKNKNIIDLIDLDNDTQNLETKYKPAPKSKTNCKSYSEDDPVIIIDKAKIKPIQTKNKNIIDLIDLDNDTQNLETKYKRAPKSKTNCKSCSEDDPVIIIDKAKIKLISTKNDNIIEMDDLDKDIQNLEVKYKPAPKSKTNVSLLDLKTNGNNKVLPINTEAGKTLSNGEFLSTTIHKRKPGPKSKTMFVGDMVPFKAENEETPAKKMRLNECEVINNKEPNTINLLNCNSAKTEVPEKYSLNLKSSYLKYPPPYPSIPPHNSQPSWKNVPPIPNMTIKVLGNKVTLTWDLNLTWQTAKIKMYELFVCQESDAPPNTSMWKKKGNIDADLLPMACELEVFDLGHIYYFALRAVDVHNRRAPCAIQKTKI